MVLVKCEPKYEHPQVIITILSTYLRVSADKNVCEPMIWCITHLWSRTTATGNFTGKCWQKYGEDKLKQGENNRYTIDSPEEGLKENSTEQIIITQMYNVSAFLHYAWSLIRRNL